MDKQQQIIDILNEITGTDMSGKLDENIYTSGVIDSLGTIELLLKLQEEFDVEIPISEFDRDEWETVNKIVAKLESLE